ncbi:hypothetical protein HYH03_009518 [Edaphochlamys debaryana]|uniref:Peptidase C1A papain C-terminal domain-containing protein n=1 Tax=Edaphochlamys debaryana TaxID=47281 RepID=A0A835Y0B1_9CHLO|nr:hypothetical protein HYH03_009518 [Edaphochlamys debaryana]|eukprot:KAG2492278.1 hypothetical protein HYH03_009518 [Edaphochlamys debaryana]
MPPRKSRGRLASACLLAFTLTVLYGSIAASAQKVTRGVDPEPSSSGSGGAGEPVPIAGLPAVAVPFGEALTPKKDASEKTDDDEDKPGCWGSVNPEQQAGYGVCAEPQPALATRSASVGGSSAGTVGDGVAPDDPSVWTPVAELKARELKELTEAKADPAAAYAKWLAANKKTYAAISPMGQAVFAEFLKVIDLGLKHNSDPDTTFACGSCWTFSTTAVIEAQASTPTAKAPYLSTQQLVDCSITAPELPGDGNNGCDGGLPEIAFSYAKTQGILLETDYPYSSSGYNDKTDPIRKTCRSSAYVNNKRMFISSYQRISSNEQDMLDEMCIRGAKALAIAMYHAVAIVGYGVQNGVNYWLVRNSWGPTWGDPAFPGYMRFKHSLLGDSGGIRTHTCRTDETGPVALRTTATAGPFRRPNCAKYGYAYGYDNLATAQTEAVAACSNYYGTTCTAVASGTNECRDAAYIKNLQDWITSYTNSTLPYYAVAADGSCGNPTGAYGADYNSVLSTALSMWNTSACSNPLVTSTSPCALVVKGSKVAAKCTDASKWAATVTQAMQDTEWGYAYAIFADPKCGNQWYEYNWDTLDQARASTEALASCTADSIKAGMGPCSLVASGVAKCTRPSAWADASDDAYQYTNYGNYWGVWADKMCEDVWYDYDWKRYDDMLLNSKALDMCNQAALDKGWSANSCGMVDSGTG